MKNEKLLKGTKDKSVQSGLKMILQGIVNLIIGILKLGLDVLLNFIAEIVKFIRFNLKYKQTKRALCLILLLTVLTTIFATKNHMSTMEIESLNKKIETYTELISEQEEKIASQNEVIEKANIVTSKIKEKLGIELEGLEELTEFDKKTVMGLATLAVEKFNLPKPSSEDMDNTNNIHNVIKEQSLKNEVMEFIEKEFESLGYTNEYIDFMDITKPSGLTAQQYNTMLSGTKQDGPGMEGLGYIFERNEKEHGVNGLLLMAIAALESGYGNSTLAKEKNNLTGMGAVDKDTKNQAKTFENRDECLTYTSSRLKDEYLSEDGDYYNGTSIFDINKFYCSMSDWAPKLITIIFENTAKLQ